MNARRCAFEALMRVEKGGAYSTLAVSAQLKECEEQDKALASALFYSVLENRELLDYIIATLTVQGKRPEPKVMQILRLGLCQLLYFDSIPESAAVNECVKLCKTVKLSYATGFVNGVLRSFLRNSCGYALPDERKDYTKYISVKYSCPMWIVKLWASAYGKELCLKTASSLAGRPPVFARVNTLKTDTRGLIEALRSEGVEAQETGDGNAVCLPACGDIERLES